MKVLLTTLNARYIHSSLAVRYLEKACRKKGYQLSVAEFTINDHPDKITAAIFQSSADVVAFSCYIWNIAMTLEIADRLKQVRPESLIILGGPEVSFEAGSMLAGNKQIDYIISGEGEAALPELLAAIKKGCFELDGIEGLAYRQGNKIKMNGIRTPACDPDLLPFPYEQRDLQQLSDKIIYYESARGCPFNCSYCLSSTDQGVRYLPLERVKKELLFLIENEVKLVKFVDRSFNSRKERAMAIFRFLVEHKRKTTFHFEVTAHLLDREIIDYLSSVPDSLFQFEIGVQSTNPATLRLIERTGGFKQIKGKIEKLKEGGKVNLHLDMIAGLPGEDYQSLQRSFNDVFHLKPDQLQLGFLKLLKGTRIRKEAAQYGYKYSNNPPYEVLENNFLTYQEIIQLKGIAGILNKYYNSAAFEKSLNYLITNNYQSAFGFFADLSAFFVSKGLDQFMHSRPSLYDILFDFYRFTIKQDLKIFREYLKFDLLLNNRGVKLPVWANQGYLPSFKEKRSAFLRNRAIIQRYFPDLNNQSPDQIIKQLSFAVFSLDVLGDSTVTDGKQLTVVMFDHVNKRVFNVSRDFISQI
ncbi:MAG: B12-binding domain-containing radical SAM protein [Halanaerobiales bacterium]|nr:B12-binding domain-containing radical SAM protein [Halanaerobiales bacterium]